MKFVKPAVQHDALKVFFNPFKGICMKELSSVNSLSEMEPKKKQMNSAIWFPMFDGWGNVEAE